MINIKLLEDREYYLRNDSRNFIIAKRIVKKNKEGEMEEKYQDLLFPSTFVDMKKSILNILLKEDEKKEIKSFEELKEELEKLNKNLDEIDKLFTKHQNIVNISFKKPLTTE